MHAVFRGEAVERFHQADGPTYLLAVGVEDVELNGFRRDDVAEDDAGTFILIIRQEDAVEHRT